MTWNFAAVLSQNSSLVVGNTSLFSTCHMTVVVSNRIFDIAWFETRNRYDKEICESPVARYLQPKVAIIAVSDVG